MRYRVDAWNSDLDRLERAFESAATTQAVGENAFSSSLAGSAYSTADRSSVETTDSPFAGMIAFVRWPELGETHMLCLPVADAADALAEGRALFQAGHIAEAILAFEEAVRREPQNARAWLSLGQAHAENESEDRAIAALRRCVECDPQCADAWIQLAVSYTNENMIDEAWSSLAKRFSCTQEYAHVIPPGLETRAGIVDALLEAAAASPDVVDANIQEALGIALTLEQEGQKAADCFRAAVSVKPDDPYLWNRLGATLSNTGYSADAVDAYRRALTLRPGFIRARHNVAVACLNLHAYREAAEHCLSALELQVPVAEASASRSVVSESLWTALRLALGFLSRPVSE